MKTNKKLIGSLMLFFAAFFWGSTFVAQSDAADKILPFTYLCARSYVGALALLAAIGIRALFFRKKGEFRGTPGQMPKKGFKHTLTGGVVCGVVLTVASALQQYGFYKGASAGEAGFLTAVYMFLVPLFAFFFYRRKLPVNVLFGAILTAAGLYFLCIFENGWSSFGLGQALVLLCSFAFAFHILAIDRFQDVDGMVLSFIQFSVCAVISTVLALIFEHPDIQNILSAWIPVVYAGLFSSAIAFTLQIYGQKYTPPAVATVLMSLESVIALLCEWACAAIHLVGEPFDLSFWQIFGCILAFCGIVLAQLVFKPKKAADNAPAKIRKDS